MLVALEVAAVLSAALVEARLGGPSTSLGHQLLVVGPLAVVCAGLTIVGVSSARAVGGLRRSAWVLFAMGAAFQSVHLVWLLMASSTVLDADEEAVGALLILGAIAVLTGAVRLTADALRSRDLVAHPVSTLERLRQRYGATAYLIVFGALGALVLLVPITGPEGPNNAALVICLAATFGWVAARCVSFANRNSGPDGSLASPEKPTGRYLPPTGEGRIRRSWRLTRTAWSILRTDSTMMILASLSVAFGVMTVVLLVWLSGWTVDADSSDAVRLGLFSALLAWPSLFVSTFLNVAMAAAASARLDGSTLTLRAALRVPFGRVRQVALWALLAAGVGVILQQIAEHIPWGGRVASWLLGAAWGLISFFVIPILALEGCNAPQCVRRSASLMRERWGEGIAGTVTINAWAVLAAMPAGLLIGVGVGIAGVAGYTLAVIGAIWLIAIFGLTGAVSQVFAVALYRYAVTGTTSGGFRESDLQRPFSGKR